MPRPSRLLLTGRATSIFEKCKDVLTQTISHHLFLWKEGSLCELHDSGGVKAGISVSDVTPGCRGHQVGCQVQVGSFLIHAIF